MLTSGGMPGVTQKDNLFTQDRKYSGTGSTASGHSSDVRTKVPVRKAYSVADDD
jgi:hypothetical protein